jgi:hypothetical protein
VTNPLVKATIDALNDHPEEWVITDFEAINNKRGIKIWIANSLYGLEIGRFGGVTPLGWLIPWRIRVWNAVWRAKAAQIVGAA